jgi:protein SCO1/2
MNRKILLSALVIVLSGVLIWALFLWDPGNSAVPQPNTPLALASQPTGGDFTLAGPAGPVALADYRGKVVVLYFGYTYCPDVCVMSLSLIAQGLAALDEAALQKVQGIFISVDPERDTPERLADYVPFFHPRLIGATGTAEQVATVARMYGSRYRKHPKAADGTYAVDHSSVTYIVAPDGTLLDMLEHATPPEKITAAINKALSAVK